MSISNRICWGFIAAAGFGVGVVLAGALVFLLELLNATVRRPAELVAALDIKPFGTVPYMETRADAVQERMRIGVGIAVILLGLPLALYLVDLYLIPLSELLAIAAEKIGLTSWAERLRPGTLG